MFSKITLSVAYGLALPSVGGTCFSRGIGFTWSSKVPSNTCDSVVLIWHEAAVSRAQQSPHLQNPACCISPIHYLIIYYLLMLFCTYVNEKLQVPGHLLMHQDIIKNEETGGKQESIICDREYEHAVVLTEAKLPFSNSFLHRKIWISQYFMKHLEHVL